MPYDEMTKDELIEIINNMSNKPTYKNHHDLKIEIDIEESYIESLKEKKRFIFVKTQPKATQYDKMFVDGSLVPRDILSEFIDKTEDIENDIQNRLNYVGKLKYLLSKIEKSLRNMSDECVRIYVYKYIDYYGIKKIATIMYMSTRTVDNRLKEIKKDLGLR